MISWLKWLFGHVKAWFQVILGFSDSETLQVHIDDPPITASLGPIERLISQLQLLERSKYNLPVELSVNEIGLLIKHFKKFCNPMEYLSQMEDTSFIGKWWMKEVRDLCYDTEDYLDQVMMQYGAGAPRTWTRLLLEDLRIPAPLARITGVIIFWIQSKLKWRPQLSNFLARAQVLKGRCPYSVDKEFKADISLNREIKADISLNRKITADIKTLIAQLVEMLAFDDKQTQLKLVPICGFEGAGKSILARTFYAKYKRRFQCWAFVQVSRNPDIRSILISILSQIKAPPASPPMSQVQDLILSISTHLKTKRYFVVIDDIRRTSVWDIISRALPGDNCGSRIIITTQSEHVASACCGYYSGSTVFQINALNACTDTITSEEKNKDINLRYNNLPLHLKTCLLYLGMHPEGCTIMKDDLVKQWVAEGFIPALRKQDTEEVSEIPHNAPEEIAEVPQDKRDDISEILQDQAKEVTQVNQDQRYEIAGGYFDELVTLGMIQPIERNHKGEVLSCTVHHMVLDLIRYKSKEENFIVVVDNLESTLGHPDIVRRLSVQFGCEKGASISESIILSQVRSLTFYGFLECVPSIADYGLLRVLMLHVWADENKIFDLTRIGELCHLIYLKIECNITVRLPLKIHRLQHLGTLELHAEVVSIPSDIGHLERLMHVCCPGKADVRALGDLTSLLDLQLTCSTVENLEEHMMSMCSILERLSSLRCLALVPASGSCSVPENPSRMCISCDSLFSASPASANLQRLKLSRRCCIFSRLPKWIGKLGKLCFLKIAVENLLMEDIDILKGMRSLTALSLLVHTRDAKMIVFGKGGFSVLTYFKFTCTVPRLEFEAGAMPNIEKLKLCFNSPIVDEQGTTRIIVIGRLLGLKEISAIIGSAGVDAEYAWRKAIKSDLGNPKVQLMGWIYSHDQDRGMETREGTGEDENNDADIRTQIQAGEDNVSGQQSSANKRYPSPVPVCKTARDGQIELHPRDGQIEPHPSPDEVIPKANKRHPSPVSVYATDGDEQIELHARDGKIELHPSPDAVIPKVRPQLRRIAGDLFTPHTMPIGPYHQDSGSCLWTQEKKLAVDDLVRRGVDPSDLKQLIDNVQYRARRYYTDLPDDDPTMDSEKFCTMLLHDGCYLLSLFVDYSCDEQSTGSSSGLRPISSDNTLARDVLYLLENQIPLFVLDEILEYLRAPGEYRSVLMLMASPVETLLERQLYISKAPREVPSTCCHLLDLVYSYFAASHSKGEQEPKGEQLWQQEEPTVGRWRRATEYRRYANMRFKRRAFDTDQEWTLLDVQLDGGRMSIPLLRVHSDTWTLLRNLMALEEHKEARPVTAYCLFMSHLACTAEDVKLLRCAKVIEHLLGTDESAAQGFAGLSQGVVLDMDSLDRNYLRPLWHRMEKRCSVRTNNFKGLFR